MFDHTSFASLALSHLGAQIASTFQQVSRMETGGSAQIGDRVSFRLADVFLPEPSEVMANLTTDVEANGVIVEFSDSGNAQRAYAVVRITPNQAVLLPVNAIHVIHSA
jgi:hypothetical protein